MSKPDYFKMAAAFRKIYLRHQKDRTLTKGKLLQDLVNEFMDMLQWDNPRFSRVKFISYIREGRC
jgi:hypothetical protein